MTHAAALLPILGGVLGIVAPVFALIAAGVVLGRRGSLPGDAVGSLNGFVVRLALPALLFAAVAEAKGHDLAQPGFVAAFAGGMALTFALGLFLGRGVLADRSLQALSGSYANTAFLGIPLCTAAFGAVGLAAAVAASLMTVCVLFAAALVLIEVDLAAARHPARLLAAVGARLARNPIVVAPLAGAAWRLTRLPLPAPVHALATLLAAAAAPCALVTIGLFLAAMPIPRRLPAVTLILKLLVQPALTALLAFGVFAMPRPWAAAATLIAALPTGTGPFMAAELYTRDRAHAAAAMLTSTLMAVLLIPLLLLALR